MARLPETAETMRQNSMPQTKANGTNKNELCQLFAKISVLNSMPRKVKINSSTTKESISTETGIEAAQAIGEIADIGNLDFALAGGIAMHIYGFTRATKDVDLISTDVLPIENFGLLDIGGESYRINVKGKIVTVDWIVRDDKLRRAYQIALKEALETDIGLKIISPEWLVIMKFFSARAKDKLDLIYLLQQKGLVDRKQIKRNLIKGIGEDATFYVWQEIESEFTYADLLNKKEKNKYK